MSYIEALDVNQERLSKKRFIFLHIFIGIGSSLLYCYMIYQEGWCPHFYLAPGLLIMANLITILDKITWLFRHPHQEENPYAWNYLRDRQEASRRCPESSPGYVAQGTGDPTRGEF